MQPEIEHKEFSFGSPGTEWKVSRSKEKEWHIFESSLRFGNKWKLVDVLGEATVSLDKTGRSEWILWLLESIANETGCSKKEVPNHPG